MSPRHSRPRDTAGKWHLHAKDTELASGTHSRHTEPPFGAEAVWSLPKRAGEPTEDVKSARPPAVGHDDPPQLLPSHLL